MPFLVCLCVITVMVTQLQNSHAMACPLKWRVSAPPTLQIGTFPPGQSCIHFVHALCIRDLETLRIQFLILIRVRVALDYMWKSAQVIKNFSPRHVE